MNLWFHQNLIVKRHTKMPSIKRMSITKFRKKVTLFALSIFYSSPLTAEHLEKDKEL